MSTLSDDHWSIGGKQHRSGRANPYYFPSECMIRSFPLFLPFSLTELKEESFHVEEGKWMMEERHRRSSVVMPVAGRSPHPPVWEFNLLPLRDSSEENVRRFLRRDLTGRPRRFARQFHGGYNRLFFSRTVRPTKLIFFSLWFDLERIIALKIRREIWSSVICRVLSVLSREKLRKVSLSVFEVLWECRPFDLTRSLRLTLILFTGDLIPRRRTVWKTRTRGGGGEWF